MKAERDSAIEKLLFDKWSATLAGVVLVLCLCQLNTGVTPGPAADLVVKALGFEPRLSPDRPLWFWLTYPLVRFESAPLLLGVFSAFIGSLGVYLLACFLRGMTAMLASLTEMREQDMPAMQLTASLAGGAALAFNPVYLSASTNAGTGTLDAVILIAWGLLFLGFLDRPSVSRICLFSAWGALGAVQNHAFFWLAFPSVIACFMVLFQSNRFRMLKISAMFFTAVGVFLGLTALQVYSFMGSEGHALTGSLSFPQVSAEIFLGHYRLVRQSFTASGWLLDFSVLVLPWLFCIGTFSLSRDTLRRLTSKDYAPGIHAVLSLIVAGVLLGFSFSRRRYGFVAGPVVPNVLSAYSFGWLSAYWFAFVSCNSNRESAGKVSSLMKPARLVGTVLVLICLAAVFFNYSTEKRKLSKLVNGYARLLLDSAGDCSWIVSGGQLDSVLLVQAGRRGRKLHVLNPGRMHDGLYRKYAGSKFNDSKTGNACELGFTPLVQEWFGRRTEELEDVAVITLPELWLAADMQPVPAVLVFKGADLSAVPDCETLFNRHMDGWKRLDELLGQFDGEGFVVGDFMQGCKRHASMVAVNLGVWMEDRGRPDLAGKCYDRARMYDPFNVSALLNLGRMMVRGDLAGDTSALQAELDQLQSLSPKLDWWKTVRRGGFVNCSACYEAIGESWAVSGQAAIYAACLKKARDLGGSPSKEIFWEDQIGRVYAREGRTEENEAILRERYAANPGDAQTLLGFARLALTTNDARKALEWIDKAAEIRELHENRRLQIAGLYARAGNPDRAEQIVNDVISGNHDNLAAWAMLAGFVVSRDDEALLEKCRLEILRLEKGRGFNGAILNAMVALKQGDKIKSREFFDEALRYNPRNVETLERILRLDLVEGVRESTARNARYLATIDPHNAVAPYVLGVLEMRAGRMEEARPWLEKSAELSPVPDVLNDLAWVLLKSGRLDDAEKYALRAVKTSSGFAGAWDTLGVILTEKRELARAVSALKNGLKCAGGQPVLIAHLARVYVLQGDIRSARDLLVEATLIKRPLTEQEKTELQTVRNLIREREQ